MINNGYPVQLPSREILPRLTISEIINSVPVNAMVYVSAPYGCGKTLAVRSWLNERERRLIWLDLKETESSVDAFTEYAARAVTQTADWDEASRQLFNAEMPPGENVLVVDNFGLSEDFEFNEFVRDFAVKCLGRFKVIVISRIDPPSVFHDLLLRGYIRIISVNELAFSAEETASYFKLNDCAISAEVITQLTDQTEGWPAALNVVLTLSGGGTAEYGETARAYVMGFFDMEIWRHLDGETRAFLLKTSVLTKLTQLTCNVVTSDGASFSIVRALYMKGYFVLQTGEHDTYRYHRMFREFLLNKLNASDIDVNRLYKKIAWWLYDNNDTEEAFKYFYKTGDIYGLSLAIKKISPAYLGFERYLSIAQCIIALDIEAVKKYPVLVARMALIHFILGNLSQMKTLYNVYLECIAPGRCELSPEEYAESLWDAGWLCYLDPDEEVLNNKKHTEWTNYREYVPHLKQLHRARASVLRPPSILRGIRDYSTVTGIIESFLSLDDTVKQVREEVSIWEAYLIYAEYLYEIEDLKKSQEIVRRIMALVEAEQMTDLYFVCTAVMVRLLRAMNTPKEIEVLTSRLGAMIKNRNESLMLTNFHAFQMRNRLLDGQEASWDVFESENYDYVDKPYYYLLYRHVTTARVYIASGDYNAAMLTLGNLELLCNRYKRTMDLIEIRILKAAALYRQGDEEGACHSLMEALKSGKSYGYIRIFSDDAKLIWPVLELVGKRMKDVYTKSVMISSKKTLKLSGHGAPARNRESMSITKAELRVLRALELGMSYDEISLDFGIKLSTVKSHVHSLYSKLDVANRTSAIIAARGLGYLGGDA